MTRILRDQRLMNGRHGIYYWQSIVQETNGDVHLIVQGWGGERSKLGARYAWEFGMAFRIFPEDTFKSLDRIDPDHPGMTTLTATINGYCDSRPEAELTALEIMRGYHKP